MELLTRLGLAALVLVPAATADTAVQSFVEVARQERR